MGEVIVAHLFHSSSPFIHRVPLHRAPVAQLVEHRAVTREVVSSTTLKSEGK